MVGEQVSRSGSRRSLLQVRTLDPVLLCPVSREGSLRELLMQLLCVLLAVVNVLVFSRLGYDYYQYKQRGKLPNILHWLPYL